MAGFEYAVGAHSFGNENAVELDANLAAGEFETGRARVVPNRFLAWGDGIALHRVNSLKMSDEGQWMAEEMLAFDILKN